MNKRTLGIAAALLLFAGLVALQVWRVPKPQLPPLATLPDGSTLRLAQVTYGTAHFAPGAWWHPVARRLPAAWQQRLGVTSGPGLSTPTPSLGLWFVWDRSGSSVEWEYALVDAGGSEVSQRPGSSFESSTGTGPKLLGRAFTAFPRRGQMVLLRIYQHPPGGGRALLASFHFPNPRPGPYSSWRPQPPPAWSRHGDLEITFQRLQVGVGEGFPARPAQVGEESHACVEFQVKVNDRLDSHWVPDGIEATDATGNVVIQRSWSGGNKDGHAYLTWSPHLWPSERAWKLRVEFMRNQQAAFDPHELIEVKGVAIPALDEITPVNLLTNRLGSNVRVLGLTSGRGRFPGQQVSASSGISLVVEVSPDLKGKRLTLVSAQDNRGRVVERRGWRRSNNSIGFQLAPAPEATSLDFTLALQEVVTGEFVVQPEAPGPAKATGE